MMLAATSRNASSKFSSHAVRSIHASQPALLRPISTQLIAWPSLPFNLSTLRRGASSASYSHGAHRYRSSSPRCGRASSSGIEQQFARSTPHTFPTGSLALTTSRPLPFPLMSLSNPVIKRHLYNRARRKQSVELSPTKRTFSDGSPGRTTPSSTPKPEGLAEGTKTTKSTTEVAKHTFLLDRLPDFSQRFHRPTKEELLAAATGFWSRLRVRFKWFSIRSLRPFNMDDISAFFSWFIVGHVIWIIVGTTTFFSLVIFTINTVFAQETLARWVGNYLTKSSGVKVVFESAIVPKWNDGVITFKKVFVSRRAGQIKGKVKKGSQISAAAEAAATALLEKPYEPGASDDEDSNFTQFDLSLETVNVTLSFTKWFNGKGLLRDVEVKGIRGVIDRTSIQYTGDYIDPRSYKHEHNPGDFELESFKMEDLLVSVYQPNGFRPFQVSIFSCDLPKLRKQYLFYDFLSANNCSGSFDESLFNIHPRQTNNYTGAQLVDGVDEEKLWKKQSRIRIDGLKIDHLNRGYGGPFSWIHEGNVDIVADVMFPLDSDESIVKVMSDFYDRMEAMVTSNRYLHTLSQSSDRPLTGANDTSADADKSENSQSSAKPVPKDTRFLVMDLRVHLNDVRAAVPLFTRDISYVNQALIRPIVAYINSKKAFIPVHCRVVKRADDFDGSWTIYDSGLMEDLSHETYEAFARDVVDDQARMRRIKKVGLWSLQLAVQALFLGLAGNVA